jgi:hypothetical protein
MRRKRRRAERRIIFFRLLCAARIVSPSKMAEPKVGVQTLISPQVDFRKWKTAPSVYRNSILYPDNGSSASYAFGPGSTQTITFTLPTANNVVNLSKMVLQYQLDIPSAGAEAFHWLFHNPGVNIIRDLSLVTQKNHALADVLDAQFYLKMVRPLQTTVAALQTMDAKLGLEQSNNNIGTGASTVLMATPAVATVPLTDYRLYTEARYVSTTDAKATATSKFYQFPLGCLKDTIFGLDRSLYFGENLTLRLTVGPGARVAYVGDNTQLPTATPTSIVQNVTVSAVQLYVPIESSDEVINAVKGAYMSGGITCLMPFLRTGSPSTSTASTRQNYTQKFTVSDGRYLQRIYHAVFGAEEKNTIYDHNNAASAKYSAFSWQINGKRQTEYDILCGTNYQDYLHALQYGKGSAGCQSAAIFQKNAVIVADYTNAKAAGEEKGPVAPENIAAGLDLSTEVKYDISFTATAAVQIHRMFAVCQRMLQISPSGVYSE